jgi:hypothetical protein
MDTSIMVWTGVGPLAFYIEYYIIFTLDILKPVDCLDKHRYLRGAILPKMTLTRVR